MAQIQVKETHVYTQLRVEWNEVEMNKVRLEVLHCALKRKKEDIHQCMEIEINRNFDYKGVKSEK